MKEYFKSLCTTAFRCFFRHSLFSCRLSLTALCLLLAVYFGCGGKPKPEKLPYSVRQNLNLLQENPQFVIYMNFKNMRQTEFWKENLRDSIINAENTFGNLMNTFKAATGVSIDDNLDEIYFANSWLGENSIILKGIFNREKLNNYILNDTLFTKEDFNGITLYKSNQNNLYFFFKDNFTLCASNYTKRIESMMNTTDTSHTGLSANENIMSVVDDITYKEYFWMFTTEKTFIRGVFENYLKSKSGISDAGEINKSDSAVIEQFQQIDSSEIQANLILNSLYKSINSISFSLVMKDDLKFVIQFKCIDDRSAEQLKQAVGGIIIVSKLSATGKEKKDIGPTEKLLNKVKIENYDNYVFIYLTVERENIIQIRESLGKTN
ncbi:MAG: hypothetical protein FJ216_00500 [Ignavibacteria bacterium]|nr:hypothetical protein [Ignavibacteria bacterium]